MSQFEVHTKETAAVKSAELLLEAERSIGFVPNLLGVFAESPAILQAYLTIGKIFEESALSPTERQIVLLAVSRFNESHYCVASHSAIAEAQKVPPDVVLAIRNDEPIADSRLEALRVFATAVVENHGWISDEDVDEFLAAGYSKAQILDVILGISFKILSNYTNHIADTPLDDAFAAKAWAPIQDRFRKLTD